MFQRIEGEQAKLVKADNGWIVYLWDPEAPKPQITVNSPTPCSQQPVRWWKVFVFGNRLEAVEFLATLGDID